MKAKFILVPHFVEKVLSRKKLPLNIVTDIAKVRDAMSLNDMVHFLTFQQSWETLLDFIHNSSETLYGMKNQLENCWRNGDVSNETEYHLSNVISLSGTLEQTKRDIQQWYFTKPDVQETEEAFKITDIGDSTYCITIYPGHFPNKQKSVDLLKATIKSAYVYDDFSDIARDQFFLNYVATLQ